MSGWTGARAEGSTPARDAAHAEDDDLYDEEPRGHHLPAGAHLHDRRGLTATGAVATALALGLAGGAFDVLTGPGLRTVFAVCFVLGCAIAAVTVHREDLVAAVVIPPIAYCVLALVAGAYEALAGGSSVMTRQAIEMVDALVLSAPVLLTATGLALVIAIVRAVTGRRARS